MVHNFELKYLFKRSLAPNLLWDGQPRSGFASFWKLRHFPDVESDVIIRGVGFSEAERDVISWWNGYPNVWCDIIVRRMTNPEVVFAFSEPFEWKPLVVFKNSACLCTIPLVVFDILGQLMGVPEVGLASHRWLMGVPEVVWAFSEPFEWKPLVVFKNSAPFEQKPLVGLNISEPWLQKPLMGLVPRVNYEVTQMWFLHFLANLSKNRFI